MLLVCECEGGGRGWSARRQVRRVSDSQLGSLRLVLGTPDHEGLRARGKSGPALLSERSLWATKHVEVGQEAMKPEAEKVGQGQGQLLGPGLGDVRWCQ